MRTGRTFTAILFLLAIASLALTWADPPASPAEAEPAKEPASETDSSSQPADESSAQPEEMRPSLKPGTDVIISLLNRQRFTGVFISRDARYLTVRIGSIETRIPIDEIDQVTPQRPAVERYQSMRSVIDDADVERLLMLIEWLRANKLLDEALDELSQVLVLEPNNPNAIRLNRLVEEERRLRDRQRSDNARRPSKNKADPVRPRRPLPGEFPMLTDAQINLLKVWEIDLENPPKVIIERKTINALLDQYGDDPSIPTTKEGREAFHHRDPIDILETMFRLRARDLYGQVKVLGIPKALRLFRDNVNATWLVNNCSTTRCHGGKNAVGIKLYNRQPRTERSSMTNFLIVERSTLHDGRPLIDYENPNRSPLLQLGLPGHMSAFPHPGVRGWKPIFRAMDSRRYRQAVEWINAMRTPRVEIPIAYQPPAAGSGDFTKTDESSPSKEPQPR